MSNITANTEKNGYDVKKNGKYVIASFSDYNTIPEVIVDVVDDSYNTDDINDINDMLVDNHVVESTKTDITGFNNLLTYMMSEANYYDDLDDDEREKYVNYFDGESKPFYEESATEKFNTCRYDDGDEYAVLTGKAYFHSNIAEALGCHSNAGDDGDVSYIEVVMPEHVFNAMFDASDVKHNTVEITDDVKFIHSTIDFE